MVNWCSFLKAKQASLVIVLTPFILLPLLLKDELTTMSHADLCDLFTQNSETCNQTITRLQEPGNEPVLFKVIIISVLKVFVFHLIKFPN